MVFSMIFAPPPSDPLSRPEETVAEPQETGRCETREPCRTGPALPGPLSGKLVPAWLGIGMNILSTFIFRCQDYFHRLPLY